MTDNVEAPAISLGAGSYDYDALKAATDAAIARNPGGGIEAEAALAEAVKTSNEHPAIGTDPRDIPGHVWKDVEGSTGQIETIQVFAAGEPVGSEPVPVQKPVSPGKPAPAAVDPGKSGGGAEAKHSKTTDQE